ncbi:hypothetical protein K435DRAFT_836213 [Dendrothele bispora CBS 962.96]|uniref:Uncharacterized protein n=1 Tax=Dendrothele bispora (strain CBS 962.96) TaxID=1314807 RepID=A0A4S8MJD2_DENBC|nr:hypothetical protein K435DRAFT_836213 [Dendrothele bispora CBS 962.96]
MAGEIAKNTRIKKDIEESQARLDSLSRTRKKLLLELKELECQFKRESVEHGRLLNLSAPISGLPPDLLSSIFLLCYCQESVPHFPTVASHVCNYWREVSLGTPLLWTNIHVRLKPSPWLSPKLHVDRLEAYLKRTGTAHYKVRVEINGNHDFRSVVELIAAHLYRCSYIHFTIANHPNAVEILRESLQSVEAPILEYLSITVRPWPRIDYNPIQFSAILPNIFKGALGAPVLSLLRLTGVAGSLQPPLVSVSTLYIDGTDMADLTLSQYRTLLAALPNLINLSLLRIDVTGSNSEPFDPVSLPSLRSVRLRNVPGSQTAHLMLKCLPVDQLECLVLLDVECLDTCLFPEVRKLTFSACDFPVEQLGHLMLAFPAVESFTTEIVSSLVLIALGYPGTPVWWPELKFLTVKEIQHEEVVSLVDLVRSRKRMECPLSKVCLDKRSRVLLRSKGLLEDLEGMVSVERHDDTEPWPSGLGYDDEDDDFWSF